MKKFILLMIGLMSVVLVSCDKGVGSDIDTGIYVKSSTTASAEAVAEETPAPTPTPDSAPAPTSTPILTLVPIGAPNSSSHQWEGTMEINGTTQKVDQTVEFSLMPATGFSSAQMEFEAKYISPSSAFTPNERNTTYGEWHWDVNGNKVREVKMTLEVKTSEFNKTLTLVRREAWTEVNGTEYAFLNHDMSARKKSLNLIQESYVERGDSVFEQKTYELKFIAAFASDNESKEYEVSALHTVEKFLYLKAEEEEEPDIKTIHYVEPEWEQICLDPIDPSEA